VTVRRERGETGDGREHDCEHAEEGIIFATVSDRIIVAVRKEKKDAGRARHPAAPFHV
jgi:hypothetical protein